MPAVVLKIIAGSSLQIRIANQHMSPSKHAIVVATTATLAIAAIAEPATPNQEIRVNTKVIKTDNGNVSNKIQLELKHKDGEGSQVLEIFGGKHNVDFNFTRFVDAKYSLPSGNTWRLDENSKTVSPCYSPDKVLAWVRGRIEVRGSCCRLRGTFIPSGDKERKTYSKYANTGNKVVPKKVVP